MRGDDGGGQPTPTATTPASNIGGSDETPVGNGNGSGGQTEPYSEAVELFMPTQQFGQVQVGLRGGDVLKFSFVSRTTVVGGDPSGPNRGTGAGVVMAITHPDLGQLLLTERVNEYEGEITADLDGEYEIIFQNPSILEGNIVNLPYSVNQ